MRKRSRHRRPKRTGSKHRGQHGHQLSRKARELHASGSVKADGEEWERLGESLPTPRPGGRDRPRLEEAIADAEDGRVPPAISDDLRRGRVIAPSSGACRVESEGRTFVCVLPSEIARRQQSRLAVGDEVLFAPHGSDSYRLERVLARRTVLARPDPRNLRRQRVIAANVDVVVQVVSVKRPPLRPALIDRCLIAIERGGATGLICVNKVDLLRGEPARRRHLAFLDRYRELGVEVIACSATAGEGVEDIRQRLAGCTAVLVGHSGVGKSSLLNALDPALAIATQETSGLGRGRHTTTRSRLYRLAAGIRIIDTPGIREFGLFELGARDLPAYFPELEPHAARCRFNDCRHHQEPDCAVRAAVAAGELGAARFETYLRILDSLSG